MNFEELKQKYPTRGVAFPAEWEKPNEEDLAFIVDSYSCTYPKSFIDFQLHQCHIVPMGNIAFNGFGWANQELEPHLNLKEVVKNYRELDFPDYLTPFREDNGDFWCFDTRRPDQHGEFPVVIWDHNSYSVEKIPNYQWKSFVDWLDKTMEE